MKAHCLPFSQVPHTTRLFTDFLTHHPSVHPFYPRSPHLGEWPKEEAAKISYDSARRERVTRFLNVKTSPGMPRRKPWPILTACEKARLPSLPDNRSAFSAVRCSRFTKR